MSERARDSLETIHNAGTSPLNRSNHRLRVHKISNRTARTVLTHPYVFLLLASGRSAPPAHHGRIKEPMAEQGSVKRIARDGELDG